MRNNNIDCLRVLCATLVVLLHFGFRGHGIVEPITRCAVPCFFMISGFFLYTPNKEDMHSKILKSMKRMVRLTLWSSAIYLVVAVQHRIRHGEPIITLRQLADFIVFNDYPYLNVLWYLYAYLYVLVILHFLNKWEKLSLLKWAAPFCVVYYWLFGKYDVLLFGVDFPSNVTRNFFGCGIPFVTIGMWIKEKYSSISRNTALKSWVLYLAIFFAFLSIAEKAMMKHFGIYNDNGGLYACSPFLSLTLFLYTVLRESVQPNWLSKIGKEDSLYIYIFHILVGRGIHFALVHFTSESVMLVYMDFVAPIVLIATVVVIRTVRWAFVSIKGASS